jgi:hypothetical protein
VEDQPTTRRTNGTDIKYTGRSQLKLEKQTETPFILKIEE